MDVTPVDVIPNSAAINPEIGLLLSILDDSTAEWRGELGEIADEAVVWQPFPGGHSIGAVILHIADVEAWWLHEVGEGIPRTPEQKALLLSDETK